jgi:hypothetical protein
VPKCGPKDVTMSGAPRGSSFNWISRSFN